MLPNGVKPPANPAEPQAMPAEATEAGAAADVGPDRAIGWVAGTWRRARKVGPVNAARQIIEELPAEPIARRKFLHDTAGAAAGTAITATLAGELLTALAFRADTKRLRAELNEHWAKTKPDFKFLGETPVDPEELAIFLPGFGDRSSAEEAGTIRAEGRLDPNIPFGYLEYSESGPTMDQLEAAIREKIPNLNQVKSLTLVCRSLGGPYGIGLAYRLGIPVKNILFISSPYLPNDGDFGALGVEVAKLPDSMLGSVTVELGVNSWRNATRTPDTNPLPGLKGIIKQLLSGYGYREGGSTKGIFSQLMQSLDALARNSALSWNQVIQGADPEALKRELKTWAGILLPTSRGDLTAAQFRQFSRVFPPGFTQVLYTATDHPTTDGTVKVVSSAYHIWNLFVNVLGLPAKDVRIEHLPYDGHADVSATAPRVRTWIQNNSTQQEVVAEG